MYVVFVGTVARCDVVQKPPQKTSTLLGLCVSSLRRGHANLLCIVPILADDPRRESEMHGDRTMPLLQGLAAEGPRRNHLAGSI